jgi:hypothetical protein
MLALHEGELQVLFFLLRPIEITLLINEPGNRSVWAELGARLLGAHAGMDKVSPPMIVRLRFIFLPLLERWSADQQNIFARLSRVRTRREGPEQERV